MEVFSGLTSFKTVLASAMDTTPPKADNTLADFLTQQGSTVALVITVAFLAPVVITISDFLDKEGLEAQLRERLTEQGWLS